MAHSISLDFLRNDRNRLNMCGGPGMEGTNLREDPLEYSTGFIQNPGFMLPSVENPAEYCRNNFKIAYHEDNNQEIKFDKGTTTLAFVYQGGIIVAVDSRATRGQYVASQNVQKVNEINEYILATIAGGAADCQFWQRNLTIQCRMYELRNRHRISVRAASKLIANTCNYYKRYGLSMGMMMMGFDNQKPVLYYVDDEGSRMKASPEKPKFSVGSGSTHAYGILDSYWHWDLTDEQAIDIGARAIYHATYRDSYSGGICQVYHFKPEGYKKVIRQDVLELHEKYGAKA